jgi:putative Ca2+/H+ antiporter (TMEM165/GDT1 family)
MRAYLAVFVTVFLAELGDKTQLATFLFAANPGASKLGVFAAAAALLVSTVLAVVIGGQVGTLLALERIKIVAGAAFIGIGLWMLLGR